VLGNTQAGAHVRMRRIYDAKHLRMRYSAEKGHRKADSLVRPGDGEKVV
jgi:hypothetical protein